MGKRKIGKFKVVFLMLIPLVLLEVGLRIVGIGGSVVYVEDPDYGYRPAPSQQFSTMGKPIVILRDGFRGPPARTNVLFVGDSVTYGTAYLGDDETFPALFGGANGGVNGWGLKNVAAFLQKSDLRKFSRIVWTIPTCDVLRPHMTLRKGLISTNRRMWFRSEYLLRFMWYGLINTKDAPCEPSAFDANLEAVRQTVSKLRATGMPVTIAFVPYRDEALGREMPETPYLLKMREALLADGVDVLDARPGAEAASYYRDAAHLSVAGSRWLAGELEKHINGGRER